jgi:hypothetical protein
VRQITYDPTRLSARANAIIWTVFALLLGGAAFYSITTTLDDMTRRDCAAGIQKACRALQK